MIKNFISATKLVRSVLRANDIPTYFIWTNDYKKCKTVKTYQFRWFDADKAEKEIAEVLTAAGYKNFTFKRKVNENTFAMGPVTAFIVRLPKE